MSTFQYPGSELAAQHRRALLEQAQARRLAELARTGHAHRPVRRRADRPWLTALKRALAVQIRPIRTDDDVLVDDVFGHLGPESRQQRFLGPKRMLTAKEVRYLTDVDHHDHEALVAVSRHDGRGLGVARYVRDETDSRSAELAVSVVDERQLQGIGTLLVTRLTDRARTEGVTRFTALMLADNVGAQRLLAQLPGTPVVLDRYEDRVEYGLDFGATRLG